MIFPVNILVLSAITSPNLADVITEGFVIRLKEMEQLIQDQKQVIESLKSGIYFTVGLSGYTTFLDQEIIKFDKVITNIGGGYIDDNNNTNYGKFVTPQNGTYQFSAIVYDYYNWLGVDLLKNEKPVTFAKNGGGGPGSLSMVLDLKVGDQVYLRRPDWVADETTYDKVTSFTGFFRHVGV